MASSAQTELMHAMLDGEASPAQAGELRRLLASDPALRREFDELQTLFADLARLPRTEPPPGFVSALMAAATPQRGALPRPSQLSSRPRVLGSDLRAAFAQFSTTLMRTLRAESTRSNADMSTQSNGSTRTRTLWIAAAVTAVVAVLVAQFGFGSKPAPKDVMGTVAPAERYRAPQATAGDIKVGTPTAGQAGQAGPATPADAQNSAAQNSAAQNSAAQNSAAQNSAAQNTAAQNSAAQNSAAQNSAAQNSAAQNSAAQNSAAQNSAAQNSAAMNSAAQNSAAQNSAAMNSAAQNSAAQNSAAQNRAIK